jgi:hypothetical protein
MNQSDRLAYYIRLIEEFLAWKRSPDEFSRTFFQRFKTDPGGWPQETFDALNWVATACESFTPQPPRSEFDVTEEDLRSQCAERLDELRRLHRRA